MTAELDRAEFVLEAMLELQRMRGRLSKVTPEDVAVVLAALPQPPIDRDMLRCGQCGDDLLPEHIEGHLNSEGRTTLHE